MFDLVLMSWLSAQAWRSWVSVGNADVRTLTTAFCI